MSWKKIHKKSNFDGNQLKLSMQKKNMYMYQKNYKSGENREFSPNHFWWNLAEDRVL